MSRKLIYALFVLVITACSSKEQVVSRYDYPNIVDISYTPNNLERCKGWFVDEGSWWGFTPPSNGNFVNGFCGPFLLDIDKRVWFSDAIVKSSFEDNNNFTPDEITYYPGELYMKSSSSSGAIEQKMFYADEDNVFIKIEGTRDLILSGTSGCKSSKRSLNCASIEIIESSIVVKDTIGEGFIITIEDLIKDNISINRDSSSSNYSATLNKNIAHVLITFFTEEESINEVIIKANSTIKQFETYESLNLDKWNNYIANVLRDDMPTEYNRVAVKSIVTLLSNWKSPRGDIFHNGVVPSHAVDYFMGFWAWDSWKHAVALAKFAPELAKEQMRAMFDYQLEDGMVIDCIHSIGSWNNSRDSKPPLAAWAVQEIYNETKDLEFVKEMYPKLKKYNEWWYKFRDHNNNGVCEFGSCDGTLEAAAWESGMDNAIRFDNTKMLDNNNGGWSMDQESVDLNAFLAYEYRVLGELASLIGEDFNQNKPYSVDVAEYFFCSDRGFFFDKKLNGECVVEEGTEAAIPLWAGIATEKQADQVAIIFTNANKFATYIPFPTIAADNPKFTPEGYWRGPIWLDQVYFGINGLRKYGYIEEADSFTMQLFDRLYGLKDKAPIHENYNTHNGSLLKAPHFSWSAAHLLMLYSEYGKKLER